MIKLKEYSEIEDKEALDFGEDVRKMHQSEDYKDYVGFNFDELVWDPDLTWEWVPNDPEQEAVWTRDAFGLDKLADYSMNIINELCHTDPQLVINKIKENKAVIGKYDDNWYGVVYDLLEDPKAKQTQAYLDLKEDIDQYLQDNFTDIADARERQYGLYD